MGQTQGVLLTRPVNTPVYNIKGNILEATVKANQGAPKEVLAEEIFNKLQSRGIISSDANFAQYQEGLIGIIQDRDQDGYYDVSVEDLNGVLNGGVSQPCSTENNQEIALTVQSSPLLETYFQDSVQLSSAAASTASSAPGPGENPELRTMSYSEAQAYFKQEYSQGPWTGEQMQQFQADLRIFMDSHFVSTPVTTAAEAANAVADNLPPVSEDLFAQMSKDTQGRVRIDCGIYAEVSGNIFAAAGMQPGYAYLVIDTGSGIAGHTVAYGLVGGQAVLCNNGQISVSSQEGLRGQIISTSGYAGNILSVNPGNTMQQAINNANSGNYGVVRFFNSVNRSLCSNPKQCQDIYILATTTNSELATKRAQTKLGTTINENMDWVNDKRASVLSKIDNALANLDNMESSATDSTTIEFQGVTLNGAEEIKAFATHFRAVLNIYRKAIEGGGSLRELNVSPQESEALWAAREYFESFNSENGQYAMFALATQALNAISGQR